MSFYAPGVPDELRDPRDPRGLRRDAPLLDGWLRATALARAGKLTPMAVPGHKQRQDLTGAVNVGDAPLYGGVDAIKHADVPRADAERRAAELWGADWCRFSVAGSTHGNQALAPPRGPPGRGGLLPPPPPQPPPPRARFAGPPPPLGGAAGWPRDPPPRPPGRPPGP